jgi:hypothetical protein
MMAMLHHNQQGQIPIDQLTFLNDVRQIIETVKLQLSEIFQIGIQNLLRKELLKAGALFVRLHSSDEFVCVERCAPKEALYVNVSYL